MAGIPYLDFMVTFLSRVNVNNERCSAAYVLIGVAPNVAGMLSCMLPPRLAPARAFGIGEDVSIIVKKFCRLAVLRYLPEGLAHFEAEMVESPVVLPAPFPMGDVPEDCFFSSESHAWQISGGGRDIRVIGCDKNTSDDFDSDNLAGVLGEAFPEVFW